MSRNYKKDAFELVQKMSLEEKALILSGENFWQTKAFEKYGLSRHMLTDGPHGLRKQEGSSDHLGINQSVPATCFPTACATACSFNPALLEKMGEALGDKCLREDVSVILGPGVNIKRSPLCGRNFEYFSEDPLLAGSLAAGLIKGVQSKGVGTSLKHFACNSQEAERMVSDSLVDERAFREIYLTAFEIAVRQAQPWTVMCSYNKINGTYSSDNKKLLTDILRGEWGFEGLVVTDWGALSNVCNAIKAGCDLEMPSSGTVNAERIQKAVASGTLSESDVNTCAERVVELLLRSQGEKKAAASSDEADDALACTVAEESMVLLKNDGMLPLKETDKVLFTGEFAIKMRYQGAGSSKINPAMLDSPFEAAQKAGFDVTYLEAEEAVRHAGEFDKVIVFAGLPDEYESEGYDRATLSMPESHNALIKAIAENNAHTAVVLQCGSPVLVPWLDSVKALLVAYLAGQAGGKASVNLLWGKANPSGKLAETWPLSLEQTPCGSSFPELGKQVHYRESIFTGYRFYEKAHCPVQFPFGSGLSYTSFAYSNLRVTQAAGASQSSKADGASGNSSCNFDVQLDVTNTGAVSGKEIVELYVAKSSDSMMRAEKELKAFTKVELAAGETKTVTLHLDRDSFRYWNTAAGAWCVEGGEYRILIGRSSDAIELTESVQLAGDGKEALLKEQFERLGAYARLSIPFSASDEQFNALLGYVPEKPLGGKGHYSADSTIGDIKDTFIGKQIMKKVASSALADDNMDEGTRKMAEAMLFSMPLRAMTMSGMITLNQVDGMVDMANGHFLRGIRKMK